MICIILGSNKTIARFYHSIVVMPLLTNDLRIATISSKLDMVSLDNIIAIVEIHPRRLHCHDIGATSCGIAVCSVCQQSRVTGNCLGADGQD